VFQNQSGTAYDFINPKTMAIATVNLHIINQ